MKYVNQSRAYSTWKQFLLLPSLIWLVSIFNAPVLHSQGNRIEATEGLWVADIRTEGIQVQFRKEDYKGDGLNGTIFPVNEFKTLPREKEETFTLTREAGTIEFTGKFTGQQGKGRYKFIANEQYRQNMQQQGVKLKDGVEQMRFFFVDVKESYIAMLKEKGYKKFENDYLVSIAALNVNAAYIQSIQEAGFKNISIADLAAFKSLDIDAGYIEKVRKAGHTYLTATEVVGIKTQEMNTKVNRQ